jgi:uncharacterized protein involved in exopolysaccharide biosynthesis
LERLFHNSALQEVEGSDELEIHQPPSPPKPEPESIQYLRLFWSYRRFLSRALLMSLVFTVLVSLLLPRRYESTATIMPPDSLQGNLGASVLAAVAGKGEKAESSLASMAGGLLGLKSSGALFTELLHSRTVQDRLIDRFQLQKVYWLRYRQDARTKLDRRTSISEDHKSGVIAITVTDSDPTRARDLAQAYVEELNSLLSRVSTSSARRERTFIEQRLVSVKRDLSEAEKQFSVFASQNTALDIKEQTKAMVESGALLQGQLIAAESDLQSLEQVYTGSNVRVRAAQARVAELKRQLQKLTGRDSATLDSTPTDEIYPSIRKLPLLGVEWADLYRRMKIQESVYELLNQQYEMARIQEAKEVPTVNIVDVPTLPEKKSFPPRLLVISFGTIILFAVALGWIVVWSKWEQLSGEDPRKRLGVEIWSGVAERWPSLATRVGKVSRLHESNAADPS